MHPDPKLTCHLKKETTENMSHTSLVELQNNWKIHIITEIIIIQIEILKMRENQKCTSP